MKHLQIDIRWNTVYHMLKSVLENHKFIKQVQMEEDYQHLRVLKKDEVAAVQEVIKILEPFEEATRLLSGF